MSKQDIQYGNAIVCVLLKNVFSLHSRISLFSKRFAFSTEYKVGYYFCLNSLFIIEMRYQPYPSKVVTMVLKTSDSDYYQVSHHCEYNIMMMV